MLDPKIYIDEKCEVHDLLSSRAVGDFTDFESVDICPGAVYVLGRDTMVRSNNKIRNVVESKLAHIVFSNPAEGATTMLGQFQRFGTRDLIESGQIMVLTGGDLPGNYRYFQFENFCQRMMNFEENIACMDRTNEIYNKVDKPYKFLFLNGRMRPHRKWLLLKLSDMGLLPHSLYTNLDNKGAADRELFYIVNGVNHMTLDEPLHYLPPEYEVDLYKDQIDKPSNETNVKFHLFNNEWGEAYIKPEPYIDTYFSLVTETVFEYPYSFRTEKIAKPLAIGHPWICATSVGFYRDIHKLGFQTFGHVIDESFDSIDNHQDRMERIAMIVDDLCQQDLASFLNECYNVCKYNQQHLSELRTQGRKEFPDRFQQFINERFRF